MPGDEQQIRELVATWTSAAHAGDTDMLVPVQNRPGPP